MACYYDKGDGWRSVVRTIRGTFDFKGRSRRMELVYFYFALMVLALILSGNGETS